MSPVLIGDLKVPTPDGCNKRIVFGDSPTFTNTLPFTTPAEIDYFFYRKQQLLQRSEIFDAAATRVGLYDTWYEYGRRKEDSAWYFNTPQLHDVQPGPPGVSCP